MPPVAPSLPRRSPTIYESRAVMQSSPGPLGSRYAIPLDFPALYYWAAGSAATADDWTTLSASGGSAGRWILKGMLGAIPLAGDALVDGNQTIHVTGGFLRTLPAQTLTTNVTITLGTTNARAGYPLELLRYDVGAYTAAIVNGGAGGGTLATFPVSSKARFLGYFDGTNWLLRDARTLL